MLGWIHASWFWTQLSIKCAIKAKFNQWNASEGERVEKSKSNGWKEGGKGQEEKAGSDIMLLEQSPALRPALNTLLTVLCTSLRLNYSTHSWWRDCVTVCVCVCFCMSGCCEAHVHVRCVRECICLEKREREENISSVCMCINTTFLYLCARMSVGERGCLESLNGPVMCGWLLSLCACGEVCTHVCQVCWSKCVFSVSQIKRFRYFLFLSNKEVVLDQSPFSPPISPGGLSMSFPQHTHTHTHTQTDGHRRTL